MNDLPAPGSTLRDVLSGAPDDLDALAARLESYVDEAVAAARGLRAMDSGGWVGEAAEAFLSSVGDVLKKLDGAASAFQEAALALRTYTAVLREAQADISRALALIDQAATETRIWSAKNTEAVVENLAAPYTGVLVALPSDDPGEPLRRQATTLMTEAQERVAATARHAADRLHTAAEHAPDKPGFWSHAAHVASEFAGGAIEATTGMATFAFKLTPAYELIDPDGYVDNAVGLFKGLAFGATHPVDFAKAVVDWDTWAKSPGRALGHLLPTVVVAVASAGGGAAGDAAEAARASEAVEELKTAETLTRTTPLDTAAHVVQKGLARPSVTDTRLDGLLNDLYRPGAEVGSGSTADALRNEIATGAATGGRWHLQKARDYAVALQRWLESHPTANDFDRAAAQAVLDDLTDATKEVPFP